jgi:DNA-binding CsgD family transcriptional regulator
MAPGNGWPALFASAFRQSRNAMVLLDDQRRVVDANAAFVRLVGSGRSALLHRPMAELLVGGPLYTADEWWNALRLGRFAGEAVLRHAGGNDVAVQWGATTEVVTGRRLVLVVALSTSRWGARFRRPREPEPDPGGTVTLSAREREVVRLVALGETGPEIAAELGITHDTVRTHVRNAMTKLGARSRAHLVAKAVGEAIVQV